MLAAVCSSCWPRNVRFARARFTIRTDAQHNSSEVAINGGIDTMKLVVQEEASEAIDLEDESQTQSLIASNRVSSYSSIGHYGHDNLSLSTRESISVMGYHSVARTGQESLSLLHLPFDVLSFILCLLAADEKSIAALPYQLSFSNTYKLKAKKTRVQQSSSGLRFAVRTLMTCQALYRGVLHHPALWTQFAVAMYGNRDLADYQSRDVEKLIQQAKWRVMSKYIGARDMPAVGPVYDPNEPIVEEVSLGIDERDFVPYEDLSETTCCWIRVRSKDSALQADSTASFESGNRQYDQSLAQFKKLVCFLFLSLRFIFIA
jgi:hypothetical protein